MEEQLIEFVKQNEFIYNKRHRHYKNILRRDKKFQELSIKINIPVKKLKERWRTLKDTFCREIKKETQFFAGIEVFPKKKWKWMDRLMFLEDVEFANNNTTGNLPKDTDYSSPPLEDTMASTLTHSQHPLTSVSMENLPNNVFDDDAKMSTPLKDKKRNTVHLPNNVFDVSATISTPLKDKKRHAVDVMLREVKGEMSDLVTFAKEVLVVAEPRKTLAQLFFEGLARQADEENLSTQELACLQLQMLQSFNSFMYES